MANNRLDFEIGVDAADARRELGQLEGGTQRASDSAQKLGQKGREGAQGIDKMGQSASASTGLVRELGSAIAGAFTMKELVDAMAKMESARLGLQAVSGSAQQAGQDMEFVRQVSVKIGSDVAETAKAFLGLSAATKGTSVEGEATRQVFEAVATSMGKAGKSTAETENALVALSQMASKGVVSMEELRGQLGEALPGALQALARGLGITTEDLIKLVESGQLAVSDAFPALKKGLDEIYGGAPQAQTLAQEITNIKNAFVLMADQIGQAGGLDALKVGAEGAQTALTLLGDAFVTVGQTIGVTLAAITTMDFSGLKQSFADIERESRDKLLKAAEHNETLRKYLLSMGNEAVQSALKQQELAKQTTASGDAATAAAQGQSAVAGATQKAGESAGKASVSFAKLGLDYSKVLESITKQITESEKSLAAREAEAKASADLQNAFGTEIEKRTALIASTEAVAKASQKVAEQRAAEVAVMRAQLDALKALGEEEIKRDPAKKKMLEDLQKQIDLRQQDAEKAKAQADSSRLAAESAKVEAEAYKDNSKRLGELRYAYEQAKAKLDELKLAQQQGKATQEQVKEATTEAAKAERLYRDALSDTVVALESKRQALQTESQLAQSALQLNKSSLEASIAIAEANGKEKEALRLKIELKRTEIAIIQETVKAQIADAEGAIAVAKAKRAELEATGQLTGVKKAEIDAQINSANAKINEAKARGEAVRVLENEISALSKSSQGYNGNTSSINQTTQALERMNAERERAVAAQEKELELAEREAEVKRKKLGVDKEGYSVDANGKRIEAVGQTKASVYNMAKDSGLTASQANQLSDQFAPRQAIDGYSMFDNNAFWEAVNELKRSNDLAAEREASRSKQQQQSPGVTGGGGVPVNINIGGRVGSQTVRVASTEDAFTLQTVLQGLAADAGRA